MYLTQIQMELPTELFPLIAHAVKWIFKEHIDEILNVRLHLEERVFDSGHPVTFMQQIYDFLSLRNFEKSVCSAVVEFVGLDEVTYKLMVAVEDRQAGLKVELVKRPEKPIL